MGKLKIGVVGASRGMDYVKRTLVNYDYAEIYAICESYPVLCEKAAKLLAEQGKTILCFTDYEEFLSCGLDGVILCNYANKHGEFAIRALEKGIHVLSEVLPCETMSEAVRLCEAVEKSGCVYAYGENYCYGDGMYEMMQVYESGVIGEAVCLEGDFINDCSHKWHLLTRGIRNHWRNYVPSTFYCTHSIGPMLYATGLRGIRVNTAGWGSVHVLLDKGNYQYDHREYQAKPHLFPFRPAGIDGSAENSDKMVLGYFVGAILGDGECRKRSIDIYRALDMSIPGLLGFRSILDGGKPYEIPDMRDPTAREAWRHDHWSTNPDTPEAYRLPTSKTGTPVVKDAVYARVQEKFQAVDLTPGMK